MQDDSIDQDLLKHLHHSSWENWPRVVEWCDCMTPGWTFLYDENPKMTGPLIRDQIMCPDYRKKQRSYCTGVGLFLRFSDENHVMLFKLAWQGIY